MDPEALLFAEVVGLIGIAGFLTLSLRTSEDGMPAKGLPMPSPVSATVLCPGWKCNAEVIIGLKDSGVEPRLGVLACDLLLKGETCDEGCVTPVVRA